MNGRKLARRSLLKSVGLATVGLPLLEEMSLADKRTGANADIPVRAFNVFFGLGIPAPLQKEGFAGVMEPLAPLKNKLLVMRGVDQVRCDEKGVNAHYDGASGAFTAEAPDGEAKAGGPSIDQVIRKSVHPDGMPRTMVPTLIAGTFFRRSRVGRYVHSYNQDGTVAATIQERPRDLFQRVFGKVPMAEGDPSAKQQRLRRSVLDSVIEDYRFYTGGNSPLGSASKARINDHLERIREYEQRAFAMQRRSDAPPLPSSATQLPPRSIIPHGGPADPGGQGIDITVDELSAEWRLLADIYALAIQTDQARFGSLTFLAAGERIRLTGEYHYDGKQRFVFDDAKQLNASGDKGCSHEWWHQFNEKKKNEALRAHAHMKMREIAYFLTLLDGPESRESNGRTILENSLITISTESGDGRHNDVKRELSGVFHCITGANGRFKTNQIVNVDAEGIDVYNSMLDAFETPVRLGKDKRKHRSIDSIRA